MNNNSWTPTIVLAALVLLAWLAIFNDDAFPADLKTIPEIKYVEKVVFRFDTEEGDADISQKITKQSYKNDSLYVVTTSIKKDGETSVMNDIVSNQDKASEVAVEQITAAKARLRVWYNYVSGGSK